MAALKEFILSSLIINSQDGRHRPQTITKWDRKTWHREKTRGNIVPKKPNTKPKSPSQSQMHSQNVGNQEIVSWHGSSGLGLYFGCQNIPSRAKKSVNTSYSLISLEDSLDNLSWPRMSSMFYFFPLFSIFDFNVLQTALWMAQYTGKTRTALWGCISGTVPDCWSYLWLYIGSDLCPLVRIPIQTLHAQEHVPRVWEAKRTWRTWKGKM